MVNKRWYKARPVVQKVTSAVTNLTYDSNLELVLHEGCLSQCDYHTDKIAYTVDHMYNPDFIYPTDKGTIYIEVKGFFQDSSECAKYKWIREALAEGDELVFVFERPNSKLPWAKKRKDGSFLTHQEWATLNNFRSYGQEVTMEDILNAN